MAPPKKPKTMGLDYEQQRQENMKRNREMIASILHQKSQLASILSPPKANKNPINKRTKKTNPSLTTPRQSLRSRGLPPPDSTSTSTPTSSSFPRVPTGQFSLTDAFVYSGGSNRPLVEATCFTGERREHGNIEKEVDLGLDARVDLGSKKENARRVAPPQKTKTMALDYEKRRQDNIQRNREIMASILHQKSQLASILSPPKANKNPINKRTKKPNPLTTPRQSLRSRGLPPPDSTSISTPTSPSFPQVPTGQFSFTDAFVDSGSYRPLVEATFFTGERREHGNIEKEVHLRLDARVDLGLKKENVRRVVGESITIVKFLPVLSRSIVISGNKKGYLGIWDADLNREDGKGVSDGLFVFFPHRSPVSGVSVHPSSVRKVYSSCYYGDLCRMDTEKEMFDIIYSSDFCIFSLSQSPHDHNSLFLDLGGKIKSFDERAGRIIYEWELHDQMVNTIDFHPDNSNTLATSSTDGFVRIWDLRCIDKVKPKSLKEVAHNGAVHSAYFSPTGYGIVSTSIDNTVRILSGPHFEHLCIIKHNNQTGGRNLPSFRAIWGWNDSYIFIGNTQRAVDVISTEDNITTPLQSEYLTNIPCRFAAHPYKEGHLACAAGPKLYLWTKM